MKAIILFMAAVSAAPAMAELIITEANVRTFYREFTRLTGHPHRVAPLTAALCTVPSQAVVEHEKQLTGPHHEASVHLYASPVAMPTITSRTTPFPVGSMIVKEKLTSDGKVSGVGGMIKRQPGYDTPNGDWEYFYYGRPGEFSSGHIDSCIACHSSAKSTDHVFSVWNLER